LRDIELQLSNL
jgi:hypothetical protein